MHEKDLGFGQEQLIAVTIYGDEILNNVEALRSALLSHAAISNVSLASDIPGESISLDLFRPENTPDDVDLPLVKLMWASEDFLETMKIELKEGQTFRPPWRGRRTVSYK